jgi:hypothetical protein
VKKTKCANVKHVDAYNMFACQHATFLHGIMLASVPVDVESFSAHGTLLKALQDRSLLPDPHQGPQGRVFLLTQTMEWISSSLSGKRVQAARLSGKSVAALVILSYFHLLGVALACPA